MRKQLSWVLLSCSLVAASAFAQTRGGLPPPDFNNILPGPPGLVPMCRTTATYESGYADNFDETFFDFVVESPALATYLSDKSTKGYDERSCNRFFGGSFEVGKCQLCESLCSAELVITYRACEGTDLNCNDSVTVGRAPFTNTGITAATAYLYGNNCGGVGGGTSSGPVLEYARYDPSVLTKHVPLDVATLKAMCAQASGSTFWVDVVVQDDTVIDSMRLVLRYN